MRTNRTLITTVAASALVLGLASCGSSGGSGSTGSSSGGGGGDKTVTLGFIPSWTDGLSTAHLLAKQLGQMGYTVKYQELSEAAPLYAGLSKGDIDIYPSAWPEVTHKSYMDQYSKNIKDLDTYYNNAKLTLAVPTYSSLNSIEDLKGKSSSYGGKIIGIEPGAGLTKQVKEQVIPQYQLSDYQLVTSSTTAMLAELKKATDAKQDIVVTLWRPFWANNAFPVKDLQDPKGALGKAEGLHFLANKEFADQHSDIADYVSKIKLTDAQYGDLEDKVVNKFGKGKEDQAVEAWLKDNPDVLPKPSASK